MKNTFKKFVCVLPMLVIIFSLVACNANKAESPKQVSQAFWQAIQDRDMESAKIMATWDTVDYLKYLNTDKLHPERFELGEQMIGETRSEVSTVLYTSEMGESGIKMPGVTVLVKTNHGWRVNVKKSMASVVKYTANNIFDQLNGLMQEGVKGLDESLSESMNELGRVIEEGTQELKRELSKPLMMPSDPIPQDEKKHSGKQI
ncbi:hypothetical protein OO007_00650 [Cocleimonas sp. KMM 6892]|jgi:hypothetical protein|uniref:hypothetical protein n=1 Tax=unclassified Cocleimonas TaxID=2639732 RepID=UPI002DBA4E53|nr:MULTISPECIES: hypothetical protein [unclassified Cocleimonas]MEB8430720.1 hypothetical protein [Cocleimonas sp. KMM 6892]MEC4714508.1 hypothetical protein [Cocleimonas sp. KMM 6895]MEC4743841.1 hypothetical protein [Cocleimonas sp. KMM 6896]